MRAAARQAGFDLDRWGEDTLYLITVPVSDRPGVIDYNVPALFLTTDTEVAAGWLEPYEHVFSLKEIAAALEIFRQQTDGFYPPVSNLAGSTVNLAQWFGADGVIEVTATFVPKDRRFLSTASASAILASLGSDSQTTNLPVQADVLGADCSRVEIAFKRRDGYSYHLVYDMRDNRLYSFDDGFSVEAPAPVSGALGVVPFTTGQCPRPPPKPGT